MLGRSLWKTGIRMFADVTTKFYGVRTNNMGEPQQFIDKLISSNKVVLFLKGSPENPHGGFSKAILQTLKDYKVKSCQFVNVLDDDVIREEIKKFSEWPTFPQLFLNKELVGGHDLIMEMHNKGTLQAVFDKHKVTED